MSLTTDGFEGRVLSWGSYDPSGVAALRKALAECTVQWDGK